LREENSPLAQTPKRVSPLRKEILPQINPRGENKVQPPQRMCKSRTPPQRKVPMSQHSSATSSPENAPTWKGKISPKRVNKRKREKKRCPQMGNGKGGLNTPLWVNPGKKKRRKGKPQKAGGLIRKEKFFPKEPRPSGKNCLVPNFPKKKESCEKC